MANESVASATGTYTGYEKVGGVVVATGGVPPKRSTTHYSETISIPSITGKYQDRFDDPTYY